MNIAIYCGSSFGNSKSYEEETIKLVKKLAKENINIVYGGSKSGLMGIVSNKSIKEGNKVFGVIPHHLASKELENTNITKLYKVKTMNQRKEKMIELSDAFIVLPGGYGTFDEIFDVLALTQIGQHKKPCAFYNINGYYDKLFEFLKSCVNEGFILKEHFDMLIISKDIDELVLRIKEYKAPKSKWEYL